MASSRAFVVVDDLRGGMNGVDDPLSLPKNQCLYALNVDWFRASVAHKRHGATAFTSTGTTMTGKVSTLVRHVPGTDETAMELWAVDDAATPIVNRWNGSAWSAPTLKDNITGNGWDVHGATVNGKLFLAYKSAQNRLHLWDGSTVRRAGIDPGSSAPTVANTGAGTYAAVLRYYRVRFYTGSGTRVSEPTPSVSFTPSGAGTAARITRPTAPNEGEEAWVIEASTDNATFYQIGTALIATTTYDDSASTASYATNTVSPSTGTFTLQKPYKFICGADNRLLGFGSHNTSDPQHRVELSAIVGGATLGIDVNLTADAAERVDTTGLYYLDLDENDTGTPTGLMGPLNGNYYAFKSNSIWELRPTGDVAQPIKATCISKSIGAIEQRAISRGEDQFGRPCVYFMSQIGPYRYGAAGLEYIGRNVDNYIRGVGSTGGLSVGTSFTIKLNASSVSTLCLYYPAKRQVLWWFAINEIADSSGPTKCLLYDVTTGGWSEIGSWVSTRAVCLYKDPNGSGKEMVPHMARSSSNNVIWVLDNSSATDDAGTQFIAQIVLAPVQPFGPGGQGSTSDLELVLARTTTGTLAVSATKNLDSSVASDTATYAITTNAGHTFARISGAQIADASAVTYTISDNAASTATWRIERVTIATHPQGATIA